MLILREQHAAGVLKMVKKQPVAIKKQKRKPGKPVLTGKKYRESLHTIRHLDQSNFSSFHFEKLRVEISPRISEIPPLENPYPLASQTGIFFGRNDEIELIFAIFK